MVTRIIPFPLKNDREIRDEEVQSTEYSIMYAVMSRKAVASSLETHFSSVIIFIGTLHNLTFYHVRSLSHFSEYILRKATMWHRKAREEKETTGTYTMLRRESGR